MLMIEWIQTFFALFVVDILYVVYVKDVNDDKRFRASLWATMLFLLSSIVIINYVHDVSNIVPAALGAFFGTYVGMVIKKG